MASAQLEQLAEGLKQAPQPVALSAAFMSAHGATPPDDLDVALAAAYRLTPPPDFAGVSIGFAPANVGPVTGDSFDVTPAQLSFLGYDAAKSDVTLRFTQGAAAVDVLIAVELQGWTWQSVFCAMVGWPFDLLSFSAPTFVFSSVATSWVSGGRTYPLAAGQTFVAQTGVPAQFAPLLGLVGGLGPVPGTLPISGPVVLDKANVIQQGPTCVSPQEPPAILYPDVDLRATIADEPVSLFFLSLTDPGIGLLIETVEVEVEPDDGEDPDPAPTALAASPTVRPEQTPLLYFGAKLAVAAEVEFDLRGQLQPSSGIFGFSLAVDPDSETWLTPAAAIALIDGGGGDSFFGFVPAPLQQFLSSVGLEGLALGGALTPATNLTRAGLSLRSKPGTKLVLFGDPTTGQDFTIEAFVVDWTILSPLDPATRQSLVAISTTFVLWPAVFKGTFEVAIDQSLRIAARFDGTVSFGDLLAGVTQGAVMLPDGVSATFSDVRLYLDPAARSYAFDCTVDAAVSFLTVDGKPLLVIDEMRFSLAAVTPAGGGATAYRGGIVGGLSVGPLMAAVDVLYDGATVAPGWTLGAALAEPLPLSDLIDRLFRDYTLPTFLPGTLTVSAFAVKATVPSAAGAASSYGVSGELIWSTLPFGSSITAQLGLAYDASRPVGQRFSGSAIGTVRIAEPALDVQVGYRFGPASADALDRAALGSPVPALPAAVGPGADSQILWVGWAGIKGEYDFTTQKVTISLAGWTVGGLLQALMRTLGDPYFTLDAPWNVLDSIPLDGLKLIIDLSSGAQQRFYAQYSLSRPINLGFFTIKGLYFTRGQDGQVTIAIDGSTTIGSLKSQPLFNPASGGQNVQNMPAVPGQGNAYFELWLLMLGQRVAIRGAPAFTSTKQVVEALQKIPPSSGSGNPVDPASPVDGQPYYNPDSGWLVATHFGLLKVGPIYTFECMLVFDDPNLYGLRLAFNGENAKVLAGLYIDVLYRKISDDVGVYQIEFSFPSALRNLDFGAFTVTLPVIGIQIYTNGDFLFDFGFPYNLNFSRSFTVQAIVYGVPVLGSAGFYFGRLPAGAVPQLPKNATGTFSSAIVFGFGLQLGVGRYFEKGPLKAGFSITVFGIVEGVIASWSPADDKQLPRAAATGPGSPVQGDYYFWLQGSFGIIGKLYGSCDFGIVKADVNLIVELVAEITYESFKDIQLSASAHVRISVSIKINCGLFSIRLSFSFSATLTADLTIETSGTPPWAPEGLETEPRPRRSLAAVRRRALTAPPVPDFKTVVRSSANPTLTLTAAPQYTVLGPEAGPRSAQQGAFVFLLAIDAPTADGNGNASSSSFQSLCQALLPWVIDAYVNQTGDQVNIDEFAAATTVSQTQLEDYVSYLSSPAGTPMSEQAIESKLLAPGFVVDLASPAANSQAALQAGASVFPPFAGLSLTFPDPAGGTDAVTVSLSSYVTIDAAYRADLTALFAQLAAQVDDEARATPAPVAAGETTAGEPLARFVFEDAFTIIATQLLQAAANALGDFAYELAPGDSLDSIAGWAVARGNAVDPLAVATPNSTQPLSSGKTLLITALTYTVQRGDTLSSVANAYSDSAVPPRWTTTPSSLIVENRAVHGLVAAGIVVTYPGGAQYATQAGDSFDSVAAGLAVTIEQLAADVSLYGLDGLLSAVVQIRIPDIDYITAAGADTLQGIAQRFGVPLAKLAGDPYNAAVGDIFGVATIAIAGLERLFVADLWAAILRADFVSQVAGMVARFTLHGMRLPTLSGLTLPSDFVYPADEADYGLYQLTGQQFPTPELTDAPEYSISVTKDAGLGWLELDGSTATTSLELDLSEQARQLYYLLEYARTTGYDAQPAVAAEADATTGPKRYAVQGFSPWATSDIASLQAVTTSTAALDASPAPQPQPMIWNLPSSLLSVVSERQAALEARFATTADLLPYLPVVQAQIGTTDPATGQTTFAAVDEFALATRVQFGVRDLAQADDLAPQRPDANDVVPTGIGNAGPPPSLAPYNYELVGVTPAGALLLERLLTAMDSLGEDLVSGLFVLYQDGGAAASGLTSRGSSELLSFITQTNLSTETNPPPAALLAATDAAGAPRGIANSPGEFVKLMWELSTVRSGGYYLYYALPDEGTGLPRSAFDASGDATLTLVVTYDRAKLDSIGAGRLTSFVNALVTTQSVDTARSVMTVQSQSAQASAAALTGTETLADLAVLYGADVGLVAAENPTLAFASGVKVPLAGIVHQIDQQDLASGDAFATIAAYYATGAEQPITSAALQAFNPGVQPALGATLRIPPLTVVAGTGGPAATFDALGEYYGLSFDALGAAARDVIGLLGAGSRPLVDSEQRDIVAGLGTGNAGIVLTRANPGEPPPLAPDPSQEQIAAFGKAYLYSLYSLLQGRIAASPFFSPSPQSMPFGPLKSLPSTDAVAHRDPQVRRASLQLAADEPFEYAQTVGFGSYAKVNAAPPGTAVELPDRDANPYVGVGSVLALELRWLDLFGNVTVTPFSAPPAAGSGPLNMLPQSIDYSDRLIGLSQWPNVSSSYTYEGPAGEPELTIRLALRTAAYEPDPEPEHALNREAATGVPVWQQSAISDLKAFTRIYFQLNQNYDAAGVHGLAGPAVSVRVQNTLLANPDQQLPAAQAQQLRDFVAACVTYVERRANAQPGGDAPAALLKSPVDIGALVQADIVELRLALILERQALLCDPALRAIEGGLSDSTAILPLTDTGPDPPSAEAADGDAPITLATFAAGLEVAFDTADWRLRVGTGAPAGAADGASVWAVRMAKSPGSGIGFEIAGAPSYLAPKPVANALRHGDPQVGFYATGKPFPDATLTLQLAATDLNALAQSAFQAIDAFLSATYVAPAFILDQLVFPIDPEKNGYLTKILEHKRTLADAVARTVEPILTSSSDDNATYDAAAEKLHQALLDQLSAAYTVTAVTVFSVTDAKLSQPLAPGVVAPPRFYGQPVGTIPGVADGGQRNFTLSSAKVPLTTSTGDGDTRLAFLFSSKNVAAEPYVPLDLSYAMSHLEHDIRHVPGIEGYEQSQWISFVTGPFTSRIGSSDTALDFPVVLRALPQPPTVSTQTATHAVGGSNGAAILPADSTPGDLTRWDYAFSYLYPAAAQDVVTATVQLNAPTAAPVAAASVEDELFAALAQFANAYPAIAADMETYLRPVDASTEANAPGVLDAQYAVAAFEAIVGAVAAAYDAWAEPVEPVVLAADNGDSQPIVYTFDIGLSTADGERARVDVYADASVPEPAVLIEPASYGPRPVAPAPGARWSFEYVRVVDGVEEWLSYADALTLPSRTVEYDGLEVFTTQNGWASVHVVRNEHLVPGETTKSTFQFSTPEVRFAGPVVPLLAYPQFDLGTVEPGPASLASYLDAFFIALFAAAGGQTVAVKLGASYAYRLAPTVAEIPPTVVPIALLTPTAVSLESGTPPSFDAPLADQIVAWLVEQGLGGDPDAQLTFTLEVFAGGDPAHTLPLLTIADVYLAMSALT